MAEHIKELWERVLLADAAYTTIPTFDEFARSVRPANTLWMEEVENLQEVRSKVPPEVVEQSARQWLRAASVDTGAIEGLYTTDRGFTMSVATGYLGDTQLRVEKGESFVRLFESHLQGFEMALDVATSALPLSESWIRQLHATLVSGQQSYTVLTQAGLQDQPLVGGEYKRYPNHVELGTGEIHAYAPVSESPHEVRKLVENTRTSEFTAAPPVVQAAYVHYAMAAAHPFPDGNGRVCRALASIYILRAASLPLLVFADDKERYLGALRRADQGDFDTWVGYISRATLDTIRRATEALLEEHASGTDITGRIARVYVSEAGVRHDNLDAGSTAIRDRLIPSLQVMFEQLQLPPDVRLEVAPSDPADLTPSQGFRTRQDGTSNSVIVRLYAAPPVNFGVTSPVSVVIGIDNLEASWRLLSDRLAPMNIAFDEAMAGVSAGLVHRLDGFARRLLLSMAGDVAQRSAELRDARGY